MIPTAETETPAGGLNETSGVFSHNGQGCITVLRDQPVAGYVSISYTPNDESSTADLDAQTIVVPEKLFDRALIIAGYVLRT